uniref:Putative replication protein n=1 Tax=Emberiza spodocephala CRESS-DNA-virus sp. TaxID=2815033 RepID=A0A8A4XCF1_9VIRU|nr:MAG: putative replication protein [Emberiza spodocephala CRESS-DNA-virus sp.]
MPPRAKRWVFTLNNYTAQELANLATLGPTVEYLVFAKEVAPATGTPHLQGFCVFQAQTYLAQAKAALGDRCHLEVARGSPAQAAQYCKKPDTPPEDIYEWGVCPGPQGRRTDLSECISFGDAFTAEHGRPPTTPEVARLHPEVVTKYPRVTKVMRMRQLFQVEEEVTLRDWQQELFDELEGEADDRSVLFYIDEQGNKGKSWFQRWYTDQGDKGQMLAVGKVADVAMLVDASKSVFFFNVPRGQMQYLQYQVLEQLKDKVVFSPKYHTELKRLSKTPHVVVFSNEDPDLLKLSADRYVIRELR